MAQKLINTAEHCVDDSIRGLLSISPNLRLIENTRVVIRSDVSEERDSGRVAIVTGAGSGHEPAFAGYVGRGFISAAVCGDIFTSPNPNQIVLALNACSRPAGILVCVVNYTGERLNFAIALERFKSEKATSCPISTVFIDDDCALTDLQDRSAGRRGLAGGVAVLKIVSAAAESGMPLERLTELARRVIDSTKTLGVSLSSCCLPGHGPIFELPPDEMELGLGIHGEPGIARVKTSTARDIVDQMFKHMTDPTSATSFRLVEGEPIVVLLNNLGGMAQVEMNILAKEVMEWLAERKSSVQRCITGALMTSLEMRGVSISVIQVVEKTWLEYLDAEVESLSWPSNPWRQKYIKHAYRCTPKAIIPAVRSSDDGVAVAGNVEESVAASSATAQLFQSALQAACKILIESEEELDNLDRQCGDGDCGTTMRRGSEAIMKALSSYDTSHPFVALHQIANTWQQSTGGTSGAIYSLFFLAAANLLHDDVSASSWLMALINGTEAVMRHGGANPGDRTMVDTLHAASEIAGKLLQEQDNLSEGDMKQMKEALKFAADSTTRMKARAGRASYVSSAHLHSPDPGAMACYYWMAAVIDAISPHIGQGS